MKQSLCLLVMLLLLAAPTTAQDDTCPSIVRDAVATIGDRCGTLAPGQVCYGHTRVDAAFWEARDDLAFSAPADIIELVDLKQIATAPLDLDSRQWGIAVLSLRPGSLALVPGQAITFLLMGDATLENEVAPDRMSAVAPVTATAATRANLRSRPTTEANIVATVEAGVDLALVGANAAGDWYEVRHETGGAWVFGSLLGVSDESALARLPVTAGENAVPTYGAMQAFHFKAGLGLPACEQAPNGLVVQSPEGVQVTFSINGMQVTLGSTVVFTMAELPSGTALVVALIDGTATAQFGANTVELIRRGDAFAVTLDENGRVGENAALVDLAQIGETGDATKLLVQNACRNAKNTGILEHIQACSIRVEYQDETSACVATATTDVRRRSGPSTDYPLEGALSAGETARITGQMVGPDGFTWWALSDGAWVRSDLVSISGICDGIPEQATLPPTPTPRPVSANNTLDVMTCRIRNPPIYAGQTVYMWYGVVTPGTDPARLAADPAYGILTLDGQVLTTELVGGGGGQALEVYWVATSGTHTVTGEGGTASRGRVHGNTCTFTVP
ncbi:MAG: SH3 domain-containing protein [Anaerolineae bacterium]|nr:SH3 domain-containing protein [Anaerolineae bacterium]